MPKVALHLGACFSLSLFFSTFTVAQDSVTTSPKSPHADSSRWPVYQNPVYQWSVSYPSEWTVDTSKPEFIRFQQGAKNPGALVGVHAEKVAIDSLEKLALSMLLYEKKQFEAQGRFWKLISRHKLTYANGVRAFDALVELGPGGRSRKIFTLENGTAVIVDAETTLENWDEFSGVFDKMIGSLIIKN